MLVSDPKGRDIKIDAYTLSFHGRLLFEGAQIELNYGRRCIAHEAREICWRLLILQFWQVRSAW